VKSVNMSPDITLMVDGVRFDGWTSARVTRSLDAVAGTFSLSLTDRWPGRENPRPIRPFSSCVLKLDGETVITGYVDDVRPSYDATSHEISVSGRDRTADLVDCSASQTPGEWHNASAGFIASELAKPFGVAVRVRHAGQRFKRFRIEEGETVFEALDRMCRMRALLATSGADGNLLLTRGGGGGAASVTLERGVNIVSASGSFSAKDRFSSYAVEGQQPGTGIKADSAAQVLATASDEQVPRYRPLILLAEDAVDAGAAGERARWERDARKARACTVNVTVQGWRECRGGPLWTPNKVVRLKDAWLGIDADLLIVSVELSLSGQGSVTRLTLTYPRAYAMPPESEKDISAWT